MDLKQKKAALISESQKIIEHAKTSGTPLSKSDSDTLRENRAEIERLSGVIEKSDADAAMFAKFDQFGAPDGDSPSDGKALSFKGVADGLMRNTSGDRMNVKGLLAAGTTATATTETDIAVLATRPALTLFEAIPRQTVRENFSFLRQVARVNNAAPVGVGQVKPTSVFTLERIPERLKVIAHLSEPIPEYWIADNANLETFIKNELVSGLEEAVLGQFLNGDGTGENLHGITTASGIQTVGFSTDAITTARRGIGALETLSMEAATFVFNPSDWINIEVSRAGTAGYLLNEAGAPIDRVKRQLWGVPVALNGSVPAGTAYVLARDSVMLFTDGVIRGTWGTSGDDFERNQVRARLEGRFEAGALRPTGIVKMAMAA